MIAHFQKGKDSQNRNARYCEIELDSACHIACVGRNRLGRRAGSSQLQPDGEDLSTKKEFAALSVVP
jgi:hypothetical protein